MVVMGFKAIIIILNILFICIFNEQQSARDQLVSNKIK